MPFSTLCWEGMWRKECAHWWMRADEADRGESEQWYLPRSLDEQWKSVRVPHCWEREGVSARFEGPVWYVTEAEVPADWQRGRIWLLLEGSQLRRAGLGQRSPSGNSCGHVGQLCL
jgi:hypothetical protein